LATASGTFGDGYFGRAYFGWNPIIEDEMAISEVLDYLKSGLGLEATTSESAGITEVPLTTDSYSLQITSIGMTSVITMGEALFHSYPAENVFGTAQFGQSTFGVTGVGDLTNTMTSVLTMSEVLNHDWQRDVAETAVLSETFYVNMGVCATESMSINESLNHDWQRDIVETVAMTSGLNYFIVTAPGESSIEETAVFTETLIHDWQRSVIDAMSLASTADAGVSSIYLEDDLAVN
jgi:hypothetical protein